MESGVDCKQSGVESGGWWIGGSKDGVVPVPEAGTCQLNVEE